MLFNKARVNKLEQRVIEEELLTIELQAKIDGTKVTIDSLEAVLKQLEYGNRIKSPILNGVSKGLNIIVSPHVGGMTWEGQQKAYEWSINKLEKLK